MSSRQKTFQKALEILEAIPKKELVSGAYSKDDCLCAVGEIARAFALEDYFKNHNEIPIDSILELMKKKSAGQKFLTQFKWSALVEIQLWNDRGVWGNSPERRAQRYEHVVARLKNELEV